MFNLKLRYATIFTNCSRREAATIYLNTNAFESLKIKGAYQARQNHQNVELARIGQSQFVVYTREHLIQRIQVHHPVSPC